MDIKAKSKNKGGNLVEEKKEMCETALETILDVVTTLQEENELIPVTILGATMSNEIISTIAGVLFMITFSCINKLMGLSNPF